MRKGNNGGYANGWLIGDVKTGEIARLELGPEARRLRADEGRRLRRVEPRRERPDPPPGDGPERDRHPRLRRGPAGPVEAAHEGAPREDRPRAREGVRGGPPGHVPRGGPASARGRSARTGRPRPATRAEVPFNPSGTVDAKVVDSAMAKRMSFQARWGSACGTAVRRRFLPGEAPAVRVDGGHPPEPCLLPLDGVPRGRVGASQRSASWPRGATHGAPSSSRSARLAGSPPPKPVSEPSLPITRWQGTTIGSGFWPFAAPTAREAAGLPTRAASSA